MRAWPRGKPPPVGRADPALRRSPADWAAAMFDTVGRRSANAEHGRATGLINGRLHAVRTVESQVIDDVRAELQARSDERRGGKECVSTCRSRWSPYH